jgi:hypothetical protein
MKFEVLLMIIKLVELSIFGCIHFFYIFTVDFEIRIKFYIILTHLGGF